MTLDTGDATLQRRTAVEPGGNATTALDGRDAGEATVYLVETPDHRLVTRGSSTAESGGRPTR